MAKPDTVLGLANEMTTAGADWQIHAYGRTVHAFTNPEANAYEAGMAYNPRADRRAFATIADFLGEVFSD
jgi:dienelactone hydrolase